MRGLCIISVVWLVVVLAHPSSPTSVRYTTFDEALEVAEVIARVRVHGRRPAAFLHDGETRICGYIYAAEVRESLKGSRGPIEFIAGADFPFLGVDRDYLVFAYRSEPREVQELLEHAEPGFDAAERRSLFCSLSAPYFIKTTQQMWFPFVRAPKHGPTVEWLEIRGVSLLRERERFEPRVPPTSEEGDPAFLRWPSVRDEIIRALARRAA